MVEELKNPWVSGTGPREAPVAASQMPPLLATERIRRWSAKIEPEALPPIKTMLLLECRQATARPVTASHSQVVSFVDRLTRRLPSVEKARSWM